MQENQAQLISKDTCDDATKIFSEFAGEVASMSSGNDETVLSECCEIVRNDFHIVIQLAFDVFCLCFRVKLTITS